MPSSPDLPAALREEFRSIDRTAQVLRLTRRGLAGADAALPAAIRGGLQAVANGLAAMDDAAFDVLLKDLAWLKASRLREHRKGQPLPENLKPSVFEKLSAAERRAVVLEVGSARRAGLSDREAVRQRVAEIRTQRDARMKEVLARG